MRILIFSIISCFLCIRVPAQSRQGLSIEECYTMARMNYPLLKQARLISKTAAYSVENAAKGYLPQFTINGQASYQSDVTKIPVRIPGMDIPELDKDQYRLAAEGTQVLYDGGMIRQQKEVIRINGVIEGQKLEVELYKLKERVNQLFFGILMIGEQLKQTELLKKDLQLGIDKAKAAVVNGTGFKSNLNMLKAELLKAEQKATEFRFMRKGYIDVLGLYIHEQLKDDVLLLKPSAKVVSADIRRPELNLFESQQKGLDIKEKSVTTRDLPKLNLFLQGGIGRPALNMLNNSAEPFAIGGLRISWPLSGFYTRKKEKAIIEISRREVDVQKENFLLNTTFQVRQQDAEIDKQAELINTDDEIIALRSSVKETAAAQLENGVINTGDYLREVNAEDQARQSKILHEIQLLMAHYSKQTTTGN